MKRLFISLWAFFIVIFVTSFISEAAEKQIVAGAGPSTKIVQLFFNSFSRLPQADGYQFLVPPKSAKHAGGIRASERFIFGRTGRPLNDKEKKLNKNEIFLINIPIQIVTGAGVGIRTLEMEQLEAIMTGRYKNWQQVGGSDKTIFVVGREKTEALYTILRSRYSFFENAKFSKVVNKDHHVVNFLKTEKGKYAISFGAKPNFEDIDEFEMVHVRGFSAGINVGLVYDFSNRGHPLVRAVKEYSVSDEWRKIIMAAGYLLPSI